MTVEINGRPHTLASPRLVEVLRALGLDPSAIAVEINGRFVRRDEVATTELRDGDRIEIVRMVCGG